MRTLSDFRQFPDFHDHEAVVEINRPEAGLHGFIAIHNDVLGPAVGGTRMFSYATHKEAITDVLRLSQAMTYKCALASVSFGGGKGVIIGDPKKEKTPDLLRAYAEEINKLRGSFYTGEDVGMSQDDVSLMLDFSPYFIGRKDKAGDPSPYASFSTFVSMKAAVEFVYKKDSLNGLTVAIKGIGKVGQGLIRLLLEEKAKIITADIDQEAAKAIKEYWPEIEITSPFEIHKVECDVYSPCALGNEFNEKTISEMKTKIICGGANNQLENEEAGFLLMKKGIVYVPDYVVNAGGLINVVDELNPYGYNSARVKIQIHKIGGLVHQILSRSMSTGVPPGKIADSLAEEVLEDKKNGLHYEPTK